MSTRSSAVVISLLAVASASEWTLNTQTSASIVAGVGAGSDSLAVAAASQNGVGAVVERLTSAKWTKKQVQTGMLLDTAVTPSGNTVATSTWKVFVSTDNGNTYTASTGVNGVSQSANTWGSNKENIALVGNWVVSNTDGSKPAKVSGVAVTKDAGATWTLSTEVPPGFARYGAFPSDNTWFVASGIWGSGADEKSEGHRFSSRMHLDKRGYSYNEIAKGNSTVGATGWFGAVSRTTDGGATWKEVFSTDLETDYLYFNGISCSSETHCVVAAEGYNADGSYLTAAYTTFDGANWERTLSTSDVGLMQVDLISETEGWLVGTSKSGRDLFGQFYHTTDGGKTWTLEQSLENCFAIDLDFAETTGFAACSSSSGSSCSVAQYV